MRLYHSGSRPARGGPLTSMDEDDCYTPQGHRRGVWLTSELLAGPNNVSIDLPDELVSPFEMTVDGDDHRTFAVPAAVIGDVSAELAVDEECA